MHLKSNSRPPSEKVPKPPNTDRNGQLGAPTTTITTPKRLPIPASTLPLPIPKCIILSRPPPPAPLLHQSTMRRPSQQIQPATSTHHATAIPKVNEDEHGRSEEEDDGPRRHGAFARDLCDTAVVTTAEHCGSNGTFEMGMVAAQDALCGGYSVGS